MLNNIKRFFNEESGSHDLIIAELKGNAYIRIEKENNNYDITIADGLGRVAPVNVDNREAVLNIIKNCVWIDSEDLEKINEML